MASAAPATNGTRSEPQPLSGMRLIVAAFALALANFVVVLDMTIATVSVPHIAGGPAVSPTQGTWVLTCYAFADASSMPLPRRLASLVGPVRLFLATFTVFGIFSFPT